MGDDVPLVVRDQLREHKAPVSVEFMLVAYVFDFPMTRHTVDGKAYREVGRNDVNMPLLLSEDDGRLFILTGGHACFVNSSFPQFLHVLAAWPKLAGGWDDNTPDGRRLEEFEAALLAIDPNALSAPETFWSMIREEMGYGII